MNQVTSYYLEGIKEGRETLNRYGVDTVSIQDRIDNLKSTIKGFPASNPVGQMLRGELDFWVNQAKKPGYKPTN